MATADDNIQARSEDTKRQVEPKLYQIRENAPTRQQVSGFLAWAIAGVAALTIGGVILTGGAVFLALATPVVIFFSPVLVPFGAFLFFSTTGIAVAVALGLGTLSAVVWLYKYLKGEEPVYFDRVDAARSRIAGTAVEVQEWARNHVPQVYAAPSA